MHSKSHRQDNECFVLEFKKWQMRKKTFWVSCLATASFVICTGSCTTARSGCTMNNPNNQLCNLPYRNFYSTNNSKITVYIRSLCILLISLLFEKQPLISAKANKNWHNARLCESKQSKAEWIEGVLSPSASTHTINILDFSQLLQAQLCIHNHWCYTTKWVSGTLIICIKHTVVILAQGLTLAGTFQLFMTEWWSITHLKHELYVGFCVSV